MRAKQFYVLSTTESRAKICARKMHLSPCCCPSKAVVLLLLIYCLMYFPFFVGALFGMHYFVSFLVCNYLEVEEREQVALFLLSYGCLVTVNVLWLFLRVQ